MRMKILAAVFTFLLALIGLGTGTASAQGDDAGTTATVSRATAQASCTVASVSADGGAFACWNPTGEHLYNCDNAADGNHPELYYYRSTSPDTRRHVSDAPTAGNCVDHNLTDIPESGYVRVKACNYHGDTQLSCDSAYRKVSASG